MKIFYDPTESRPGTRLSQGIIQAGTSLPGLERATGADLLVSPLDIYLDAIDDTLPSQEAFRHHCESGALIQRKNGMDLVGSIAKLDSIQAKMQKWGNQTWLLVVGTFFCTETGQLSVDHYKTDFSYNAVIGALNWWQLRGGSVVQICSEVHVGAWVRLLVQALEKAADSKEKVVEPKTVMQRLTNEGGFWQDDVRIAAKVTLGSFPGMGPHRAELLAEKFGSLGCCMEFLSDIRLWGEMAPKGIGMKTLELARRWLGMTDGVYLDAKGMHPKEFKEMHGGLVKDKRYVYEVKEEEANGS